MRERGQYGDDRNHATVGSPLSWVKHAWEEVQKKDAPNTFLTTPVKIAIGVGLVGIVITVVASR